MSVSATVLIADDQTSPRNRVASILREAGYRVLLAADGLQALANCRREQPDIVILDMVMPHMDGIAVCRALRGDPILPYIPVMFCSSHDDAADRVTGLRAGGDDFVGKSIGDEELLARVEALVRVKKLLDEALRTHEPSAAQVASADGEPIAGLDQHLDREFARALKNNQPLSLVIVAVAAGGDVAKTLQACGRGNEIVTSHPDKGYAVLLPNTHFGGAMASAERIWRSLPPSSSDGSPGATIGAASYPNPEISSAADLVDFAHAALDRAHGEGQAYICLYHHQAYLFRPDE